MPRASKAKVKRFLDELASKGIIADKMGADRDCSCEKAAESIIVHADQARAKAVAAKRKTPPAALAVKRLKTVKVNVD